MPQEGRFKAAGGGGLGKYARWPRVYIVFLCKAFHEPAWAVNEGHALEAGTMRQWNVAWYATQ